ncbi:MAG: flavin oxidoreductase/NADH oxidase [Clostridia bacterium]|nr:flavin oxidoreductase/NADH oxidase [Clostridia bacterium]
MLHETFHYDTLSDVRETAEKLGAFLPLSLNTKALFAPLALGAHTAPNRIAFQPMEGTDGAEDGAPGELTVRRYERFAKAGPGLIWFEAVATVPEGRASAHQLYLTEKNVDQFKRLVDRIREVSMKENGYAPVIVMQATNSGRYAKPHGYPEPLIAYNCPPLEDTPLAPERIVSDDDLRRYEAAFGTAAKLAQEAGFDGMDVKCCHRYLACELLSAYTRPGEYGGSYENRTRFLKNAYRAAQAEVKGDFFLTSRLNAYDGFPYPYGFGVHEGSLEADMTEAIRLVGELKGEFGIPLIDITMGNPYKNPHVNRPYDHGNYVPDEHPFEGLGRIMKGTGEIQAAHPDLPVLGSAFSYLRQFAPNLAAGMVEGGHCAMAGFGRMAFAHPNFVRELRDGGAIDKRNVCVTCGGCAVLLRAGRPAGCVVRDREVYKL